MSTPTVRKPVIHVPAPLNPLEEAENILRTDGWTVGTFKCDDGKRCAVGALRVACGMRENTGKTRFRNRVYLRSLTALAAAIDKNYKSHMAYEIRGAVSATSYFYGQPTPAFDSLTREQQIAALEEFVWTFNDNQTDDRKGRNMILRRFTKAAEAYATS